MVVALETSPAVESPSDLGNVIVADDFLPDPMAVRRQALDSEFIDWDGPDGQRYKRICVTEVPGVRERIERAVGPVDMLGMGYRLNFDGERPNAAVHSDLGWGTHALVLFLSKGPGGTAFWRHKATGAHRIDVGDADLLDKVSDDWNDESAWDRLRLVRCRFNRGLIYESALFHSRHPFEAFGEDEASGRLLAVAFFTPKGAA